MKKTTLIIFLILPFTLSFAQEVNEMSSDRPGFAESSSNLSIKDFQAESGFVFEKFDSNINNYTFNTTLLRYGLLDYLELRLGFEYLGTYVSLDGGDRDWNGFGPLKLGTKLFIMEESEGTPQLAFLSTFTVPNTGSSVFEADNFGAEFKLAGDYSLNEAMSLGANVGVFWSGQSEEDYAVGLYAFVVDLTLTNEFGVFAELYGLLPNEGKNDHRWDGGITYGVNENLQLDFSAGVGLSKVSPDFFISLGLSIRMP